MKRFALSFSIALALAACGGGGDPASNSVPAQDAVATARLAEMHAARTAAAKEKPLQCIFGCGGIFGAQAVYTFSGGYGAQSGSRYYQEGSLTMMRFDSADSSQWVEYTMVQRNEDTIQIDLRTNESYVASIEFDKFGSASVMFYMERPGEFVRPSTNIAPLLGMRTPQMWQFGEKGTIDTFFDRF